MASNKPISLTETHVTTHTVFNKECIHAGDIVRFDYPAGSKRENGVVTPRYTTLVGLVLRVWTDRLDIMPVGSCHQYTLTIGALPESKLRVVMGRDTFVEKICEVDSGGL